MLGDILPDLSAESTTWIRLIAFAIVRADRDQYSEVLVRTDAGAGIAKSCRGDHIARGSRAIAKKFMIHGIVEGKVDWEYRQVVVLTSLHWWLESI